MEKARNAEAKANLYPPFYIKEINSKCPKNYCPLVKKDKEDANWVHRNKVFNKNTKKAKSHNPFFANQPQAQASKKRLESRQRNSSATRINATKVTKKDKDETKDLSHVKYYTYK